MGRPILCLDFDGVIHDKGDSRWTGAGEVNGEPVEGALDFINEAVGLFEVNVYSSRTHRPGGLKAMQVWLAEHLADAGYDCFEEIVWPVWKPGAVVTLDDRAVTFVGEWPDLDELRHFTPWNKL